MPLQSHSVKHFTNLNDKIGLGITLYGHEADRRDSVEMLAGTPVQTERIAFRQDEMVVCTKCAKTEPAEPCGLPILRVSIELPEELLLHAKLNLRPLENWEKGFN